MAKGKSVLDAVEEHEVITCGEGGLRCIDWRDIRFGRRGYRSLNSCLLANDLVIGGGIPGEKPLSDDCIEHVALVHISQMCKVTGVGICRGHCDC